MIRGHTPPFDLVDWITPASAVRKFGVPLEIIEQAALDGTLRIKVIAGEQIIHRGDLQALILQLRAQMRGCAECQD